MRDVESRDLMIVGHALERSSITEDQGDERKANLVIAWSSDEQREQIDVPCASETCILSLLLTLLEEFESE